MTGLYLASIEARKCLQGEVSDTVWRRVGILYGTFSGRRSGGAGTPGLSGPAAAQQECRA